MTIDGCVFAHDNTDGVMIDVYTGEHDPHVDDIVHRVTIARGVYDWYHETLSGIPRVRDAMVAQLRRDTGLLTYVHAMVAQ